MKLTEYQNLKLANTKFMIGELSKMQDAYYDSLLVSLENEDCDGFLFDYVFNGKEETFEEYLAYLNKNLEDL